MICYEMVGRGWHEERLIFWTSLKINLTPNYSLWLIYVFYDSVLWMKPLHVSLRIWSSLQFKNGHAQMMFSATAVSQHSTVFFNVLSSREKFMMTSSKGNIFRVTGHLCGEFTGPPTNGKWRGALMFSLTCEWINGWVNNRGEVDLRRYRAHYYVTIMFPSGLLTRMRLVVSAMGLMGTIIIGYISFRHRLWDFKCIRIYK